MSPVILAINHLSSLIKITNYIEKQEKVEEENKKGTMNMRKAGAKEGETHHANKL